MPKSPKSSLPQSAKIDSKDKVIAIKPSYEPVIEIIGDKGQSNDEDQDMYTTRSK